jgi:hypothetical protein
MSATGVVSSSAAYSTDTGNEQPIRVKLAAATLTILAVPSAGASGSNRKKVLWLRCAEQTGAGTPTLKLDILGADGSTVYVVRGVSALSAGEVYREADILLLPGETLRAHGFYRRWTSPARISTLAAGRVFRPPNTMTAPVRFTPIPRERVPFVWVHIQQALGRAIAHDKGVTANEVYGWLTTGRSEASWVETEKAKGFLITTLQVIDGARICWLNYIGGTVDGGPRAFLAEVRRIASRH